MLGEDTGTNSLEFYKDAVQWRWLLPEEVFELIKKYEELGCFVSTSPPECPPSGSIFMYDRRKCKRFRRDGHNWVTRKSAGRIREDHVKLRVGGIQRVAAAHAHSADSTAFHRRTYHLLNIDEDNTSANENDSMWISVVHYRECEAKEDGARKIRRDRGRAQALAAEEVNRVIASTDFDALPLDTPDEEDALFLDTVTELFGSDKEASSPGPRTVDGAVDALTGQPVPCWRLAPLRSPQQQPTASSPAELTLSSQHPQREKNIHAFHTETNLKLGSSSPSALHTIPPNGIKQENHNHHHVYPLPSAPDEKSSLSQVPPNGSSWQQNQSNIPPQQHEYMTENSYPKQEHSTTTKTRALSYRVQIIDISPCTLFCSEAQENKLLVLLNAPLQSLADEYTQGDSFGIRFVFESSAPLDVEATVVNSLALRCQAPRRPEPCQAFIQLILLRRQNQVLPLSAPGTEANTILRWTKLPQAPLPDLSQRKSKLVFAQGIFPTHSSASSISGSHKRTIAQRSPAGTSPSFFVAPPQPPTNQFGSKQQSTYNVYHGSKGFRPGPIAHNIPEHAISPAASAITTTTSTTNTAPRRSSSRSSWSSMTHLPSPAASDVLDDEKLASAPDAELDSYVERLVLKVLGQMSQVAATDNELADELNAPDAHGLCLLHYCALYNLSSVIAELVALGAHPDGISGNSELTPLHLAAGAGHVNVVLALLEAGADVGAIDPHGKTSRDRAIERGQHKVAAIIDESPRALLKSDRKRARRDRQFFASSPQHSVEPIAAGDKETMRLNKALLHTAFSSLSLHEKCALSMADSAAILRSPTSPHCECPQTGAILGRSKKSVSSPSKISNTSHDPQDTGPRAPSSLPSPVHTSHNAQRDVSMADATRRNDQRRDLDVAISLMGASELSELQDEASVITANARSWIVRRNYKKVRDAARLLEAKWMQRKSTQKHLSSVSEIEHHRSSQQHTAEEHASSKIDASTIQNENSSAMLTSPVFNSVQFTKEDEPTSFVKTLQAHSRGMLERKKLSHIKQQMCALLVISRNFRGRLSGLRRNSSSSVASSQSGISPFAAALAGVNASSDMMSRQESTNSMKTD